MENFKKILFWILFPVLGLVIVIVGLLKVIIFWIEYSLNIYEGWSFNLKEKGWFLSDSGLWIKEARSKVKV